MGTSGLARAARLLPEQLLGLGDAEKVMDAGHSMRWYRASLHGCDPQWDQRVLRSRRSGWAGAQWGTAAGM